MRCLIVEEQLRNACSHHLQYLRTIREAALEKQMEICIAANVEFDNDVAVLPGARPVLRDLSRLASSNAGGRWRRHGMLLRNIFTNAGEVRRLLNEAEPFDGVLCLTSWWPQMASLLLTKCMTAGKFPPLGLLFVNYPRSGKRAGLQFDLVRLLVKFLGDEVRIFAETKYAQRSWAVFLGRAVEYVVHPVGPAELATENAEKLKSETLKAEGTTDYTDEHGWEQGKAESGNTEKLKLNQESTDQAGQRLAGQAGASESDSLASKLADAPVSESLISSSDGPASSPATSYSQPDTAPEAALALDSGHSTLDSKTTAKPLVFGFYGFARHEQGVDVLMRALEILKDQGEWESEFRIVWPQAFQMPDGSWLEPKMFEHLKERVRFFEKPLSPQEYQEQLSETDWLLLPYRVGSYQGRCSRISIEACVMGIPVIYTNGTDLEEVVANHGAGIGVPEEDADALANAIRLALEENRAFKEKAVVKQVHARAIFSGRYFLEAILAKN